MPRRETCADRRLGSGRRRGCLTRQHCPGPIPDQRRLSPRRSQIQRLRPVFLACSVALLSGAVLTACRPIKVQPVTTPAARAEAAGTLATDGLSAQAENTLDHAGGAFSQALQAPFGAWDREDLAARIAADPALAAALAEVAILTAQDAGDETTARLFDLQAAITAWDGLMARFGDPEAGPADPLAWHLLMLYNRAVGRWLERFEHPSALADSGHTLAKGSLRVALAQGAHTWSASDFDHLQTADGLAIEGLRQRYVRPGLGAAMIGLRGRRAGMALARFMPARGIADPVTAVLVVRAPAAGQPRRATLHLLDPAHHQRFALAGRPLAVAADFTAPLALLLSQRRLDLLGYGGAIRPQRFEAKGGLFLLEPYDPDKTPVLMIHGLLSSPLAFAEITNDVWGDQHLRAGFQVWHFMYPTGLPYLWAASELRNQLAALRAAVDPKGDNPAWNDMVIIAHSMGGLVARTLATTSGDRLWRTVFRVPAAELDISAEHRQTLEEILVFKRLPQLHRVVFLATPHHGVQSAGSLAGKAVSFLIKLPRAMREVMRDVIRHDAQEVEPSMRRVLEKGGPSSVRALRASDPILRALAELPIDPAVTTHSILGDRGRGDGDRGSDGYVPYTSAHLPSASSELIVPSGHNVYEHPLALAEIRRILHRHLLSRARGAQGRASFPQTTEVRPRREAAVSRHLHVTKPWQAPARPLIRACGL